MCGGQCMEVGPGRVGEFDARSRSQKPTHAVIAGLTVSAPRGGRALTHSGRWAILPTRLPAPSNTVGRSGPPEKHWRQIVLGAVAVAGSRWDRAAHPRAPARPAVEAGRKGSLSDRGDHRFAIWPGRWRGAPIRYRMGRRKTNNRCETPHRHGRERAVVGSRGDHGLDSGPRRAGHRSLAVLRGTFSTIRLVWVDGDSPGRLLEMREKCSEPES